MTWTIRNWQKVRSSNAAIFRDAGDVSKAVDLLRYWKAINDLLARAEEFEERAKRAENCIKNIQDARDKKRPSYVVDAILKEFYCGEE